jgi:iron(III) transport system ATP-binding protein
VAFGVTGSRSEVADRVRTLLARVDLKGYADKSPHMLSGGEQQRVALARAMAPRPRIMLMDEPFSGLDNRLRDGIRDETLQLLKEDGTAVILVTHEPEEAMRMGDQIALMRAARSCSRARPTTSTTPLRPGCGGVFQRYQRGDGHGAGRADDDALR